MALQIRRGTETERLVGGGIQFANGELIYVTNDDGYGDSNGKSLYIGDGATQGGILIASTNGSNIGGYLTVNTGTQTLQLLQNLDLNGQDITGTGNINITGDITATNITATGVTNIGDDANNDTVDFSGSKVASTLTPTTDSAYDIGTATARWNNGYFTGLVIDGQVDAVAVNADVIADNSTVMVDVSANTLTGDLTGDTAGTHTGAVVGNVTGNAAGDHTGTFNGTVGDVTPGTVTGTVITANTNFAGNITGDVTGNVTGNVTGSVKGSGGDNVLSPNTGPADAEISVLNVTATGTINGNVSGNLTGNAAGDHTGTFAGVITATGTLDGDVTGSIFSDGSVLLVDGVNGIIPGSVVSGTVTADLVGNVTGDVTGNVTGNVITNNIDSSDSTAINVIPQANFAARINAQQEIQVGDINGIFIDNDSIAGWSNVRPSRLTINYIAADVNDETTELEIESNSVFKYDVTVEGKLQAFGDRAVTAIHRTQLSETNSGFFVTEYSGNPTDPTELQDIANYTIKTKIVETVADFGTAVKFANMDTTTRDALTAEAGMVIFNTTDTKLQVCTVGGVTPTWVDLH